MGLSSEVVGFLVGALAGVVIDVVTGRRPKPTDVATRLREKRPRHEWETAMPAPRTSMRPRWEGALDPADEDDWLESMVVWIGSVAVAVATVATSWWLGPFAAFAVLGLTAVGALAGLRHWTVGRDVPPGGRQVVLRTLTTVVIAGPALMWVTSTTHRGLTLDRIHDVVFRVPLTEQPGVLTRDLDAEGWVLLLVLAAGITLAVAALVMALVDVLATFAMTRLGEGSTNAFTGWMASFYPRRQARPWVSAIAISLLAFLLCTGTVLRWYDEIRG